MNTKNFIFKEITIRNFLSFSNAPTTIDLTTAGTALIEGQNLDTGGANGVGKTAIINAVCYALYNKPFDNISLQQLINNTNASKNTLMEVTLTFDIGEDAFEITRIRGESYTIRILKNGADITPGKGVTECDALIEDLIGLSYDLFVKTVIFSGNVEPFLSLPVAQQRLLIEELFNITLLSEKAQLLRKQMSQTEMDIKVQEAVVQQQQQAVALHETHVRDAAARVKKWEESTAAQIVTEERTLASIDGIDFEEERRNHELSANLANEIAAATRKLQSGKAENKRALARLEELAAIDAHLRDAKCPFCLQSMADTAEKLEQTGREMDGLLASTDQLSTEIAECERSVGELLVSQKEVTAKIKVKQLDQLLKARENRALISQKIEALRVAVNPYTEIYERLRTEVQAEIGTSVVDELKKRHAHQQFLYKLLTNKDSFLRRRIINKSIPFLNDRINGYADALGLPHVVKFDADLSCTVSEFGRELDFGNLSAGEKKRVNIAMALAFRDVLHYLHMRCNLLMIDELDGQLDTSGLDAVVKILKEKSRDESLSIFVISHHPAISGRMDRVLRIKKEHGFSSVY